MTEQQIIETLATKVMGWKLSGNWWNDEYGYPAQNKLYWNPLQNIADADKLLDKFEYYAIHQHATKGHKCYLIKGRVEVEAYGATRQAAISNAAYKTASKQW